MVDGINGHNKIQDAGLMGLGQTSSVEKVNQASKEGTDAVETLKSFDQISISTEAKDAYEREKEILKFARLAMRLPAENASSEKVSQLKNMLDSGRINEYLNSLNTTDIADSILDSASGAFLR